MNAASSSCRRRIRNRSVSAITPGNADVLAGINDDVANESSALDGLMRCGDVVELEARADRMRQRAAVQQPVNTVDVRATIGLGKPANQKDMKVERVP